MSKYLYVGNDNRVTVDALRDADENYINTATVSATLLDAAGVEVDGATWPVSLPYVAESHGRYQGIIDDAVEIIDGRSYTLVIDATEGTSVGHWELPVKAVARTKWT